MIVFPALFLLSVVCIPTSVVFLSLAYEQWRPNACVQCKYDLRGSPTRRCAECGFVSPPYHEPMNGPRQRWLLVLGLTLVAIPCCAFLFFIATLAQTFD